MRHKPAPPLPAPLAGREGSNMKIDTSIAGWFRALRAVDSMFQDWECIGWFRTRQEALSAFGGEAGK